MPKKVNNQKLKQIDSFDYDSDNFLNFSNDRERKKAKRVGAKRERAPTKAEKKEGRKK